MDAKSPAPDNHLTVTSPCPEWFHKAMAASWETRHVQSDGCRIQYMLWDGPPKNERKGGLLFVHGGGGHGHWWSFLAPYFSDAYRVVAPDLSGMGDSGHRSEYSSQVRAAELGQVIEDADLGRNTIIVGHSFGGLIATRFAKMRSDEIDGLIIVDSPIREPSLASVRPPRSMGKKRYYSDFETALSRFRLMPEQLCENAFLVEHIGRNSLKREDRGWTWKFHGGAMHHRRFAEPYNEYLAAVTCRTALIYGEQSALLSRETVDYMISIMVPGSPVISIPEARHHLTLDQPMAFVTALRAILDQWGKASRD